MFWAPLSLLVFVQFVNYASGRTTNERFSGGPSYRDKDPKAKLTQGIKGEQRPFLKQSTVNDTSTEGNELIDTQIRGSM